MFNDFMQNSGQRITSPGQGVFTLGSNRCIEMQAHLWLAKQKAMRLLLRFPNTCQAFLISVLKCLAAFRFVGAQYQAIQMDIPGSRL